MRNKNSVWAAGRRESFAGRLMVSRAAETHTVPLGLDEPDERAPLRLRRLGRREALVLSRDLSPNGCGRIVLAAYPEISHAATLRAEDGGRVAWLRHRFQLRPGDVERLAEEALRVAGVRVETRGGERVRVAGALLGARAGRWSNRAELARVAYPTRSPGLRANAPRPLGAVGRRCCRARRRGAGRPARRRSSCASRAGPSDSDGPGETGRLPDDVAIGARS